MGITRSFKRHNILRGREEHDCHPVTAITGLNDYNSLINDYLPNTIVNYNYDTQNRLILKSYIKDNITYRTDTFDYTVGGQITEVRTFSNKCLIIIHDLINDSINIGTIGEI